MSSDSGNSTDEEKNIRDDYVHPNSLKAWKQKKEKEQQELEQQQAVKAKRPPSGTKGGKPKSPKGDKTGTAVAVKPPTPREKSPKRVKSPKRPSSAAPSEKSVVSDPLTVHCCQSIKYVFFAFRAQNQPSIQMMLVIE